MNVGIALAVARRQSLQWHVVTIGDVMSPWPLESFAGQKSGREESAGAVTVSFMAPQVHPPWRVKWVEGTPEEFTCGEDICALGVEVPRLLDGGDER